MSNKSKYFEWQDSQLPENPSAWSSNDKTWTPSNVQYNDWGIERLPRGTQKFNRLGNRGKPLDNYNPNSYTPSWAQDQLSRFDQAMNDAPIGQARPNLPYSSNNMSQDNQVNPSDVFNRAKSYTKQKLLPKPELDFYKTNPDTYAPVLNQRLNAIDSNPERAKHDFGLQKSRDTALSNYVNEIVNPFVQTNSSVNWQHGYENIGGQSYYKLGVQAEKPEDSWHVYLSVDPSNSTRRKNNQNVGSLRINDIMVAPNVGGVLSSNGGVKGLNPTSTSLQNDMFTQLFSRGNNPFSQISKNLGEDARGIWSNPRMQGAMGTGLQSRLNQSYSIPSDMYVADKYTGAPINLRKDQDNGNEFYNNLANGGYTYYIGKQDLFTRAGILQRNPDQSHAFTTQSILDVPGYYSSTDKEGNISFFTGADSAIKTLKRIQLGGMQQPTNYGTPGEVDNSWKQGNFTTAGSGLTPSGYSLKSFTTFGGGLLLGEGQSIINLNSQANKTVWQNRTWKIDLPTNSKGELDLSDELQSQIGSLTGQRFNNGQSLDLNGVSHDLTGTWREAQIQSAQISDNTLFLHGVQSGNLFASKYGTKSYTTKADLSSGGLASLNKYDLVENYSGDPLQFTAAIFDAMSKDQLGQVINSHLASYPEDLPSGMSVDKLLDNPRHSEDTTSFLMNVAKKTVFPQAFTTESITRTVDADVYNRLLDQNSQDLSVLANSIGVQPDQLSTFIQSSQQLNNGQYQIAASVPGLALDRLFQFRPEERGDSARLNIEDKMARTIFGQQIGLDYMNQIGSEAQMSNLNVMRAALVNSGLSSVPSNTASLNDITSSGLQGYFDSIQTPEDANSYQQQQARLQALQSMYGDQPITAKVGDDQRMFASPNDVARFSVQGDTNKELQGYVRNYVDTMHEYMQNVKGGNENPLPIKKINKLVQEQSKLADNAGFRKVALSGGDDKSVRNMLYSQDVSLPVNTIGMHWDDIVDMEHSRNKLQGGTSTRRDIESQLQNRINKEGYATTAAMMRYPDMNPSDQSGRVFNVVPQNVYESKFGGNLKIERGQFLANPFAIGEQGGDTDSDSASVTTTTNNGQIMSASSSEDIIQGALRSPSSQIGNLLETWNGFKKGSPLTPESWVQPHGYTEQDLIGASMKVSEAKKNMGKTYNWWRMFEAAISPLGLSKEQLTSASRIVATAYQNPLDLKDLTPGAQILQNLMETNFVTGHRTFEDKLTGTSSGKSGGGAENPDVFSNEAIRGVLSMVGEGTSNINSREAASMLVPSSYLDQSDKMEGLTGRIQDIVSKGIQSEDVIDLRQHLTNEVGGYISDENGNPLQNSVTKDTPKSWLFSNAPAVSFVAAAANKAAIKGDNFSNSSPLLQATMGRLSGLGARAGSVIDLLSKEDLSLPHLASAIGLIGDELIPKSQNYGFANGFWSKITGALGIKGDSRASDWVNQKRLQRGNDVLPLPISTGNLQSTDQIVEGVANTVSSAPSNYQQPSESLSSPPPIQASGSGGSSNTPPPPYDYSHMDDEDKEFWDNWDKQGYQSTQPSSSQQSQPLVQSNTTPSSSPQVLPLTHVGGAAAVRVSLASTSRAPDNGERFAFQKLYGELKANPVSKDLLENGLRGYIDQTTKKIRPLNRKEADELDASLKSMRQFNEYVIDPRATPDIHSTSEEDTAKNITGFINELDNGSTGYGSQLGQAIGEGKSQPRGKIDDHGVAKNRERFGFGTIEDDRSIGQVKALGDSLSDLGGILEKVKDSSRNLTKAEVETIETHAKMFDQLNERVKAAQDAAISEPGGPEDKFIGRLAGVSFKGKNSREVFDSIEDHLSSEGGGLLEKAQLAKTFKNYAPEGVDDSISDRFSRLFTGKSGKQSGELAKSIFNSDEWQNMSPMQKAGSFAGGAAVGLSSAMLNNYWALRHVWSDAIAPVANAANQYTQLQNTAQQLYGTGLLGASDVVNSSAFQETAGYKSAQSNYQYRFAQSSFRTWSPLLQAGNNGAMADVQSIAEPSLGAGIGAMWLAGNTGEFGAGIAELAGGVTPLGLGVAATIASIGAISNMAQYQTDKSRQIQLMTNNNIQGLSGALSDPLGVVSSGFGAIAATGAGLLGQLGIQPAKDFSDKYWNNSVSSEITSLNAQSLMEGHGTSKANTDTVSAWSSGLWNQTYQSKNGVTKEQYQTAFNAAYSIYGSESPNKVTSFIDKALPSVQLTGDAKQVLGLSQILASSKTGLPIYNNNNTAMRNAAPDALNLINNNPQVADILGNGLGQQVGNINNQLVMSGMGAPLDATSIASTFATGTPDQQLSALHTMSWSSARSQMYQSRLFATHLTDASGYGSTAFEKDLQSYSGPMRQIIQQRSNIASSMYDMFLASGYSADFSDQRSSVVAQTSPYADDKLVASTQSQLTSLGLDFKIPLSSIVSESQAGFDPLSYAATKAQGRGISVNSDAFGNILQSTIQQLTPPPGMTPDQVNAWRRGQNRRVEASGDEATYNTIARNYGMSQFDDGALADYTPDQRKMVVNSLSTFAPLTRYGANFSQLSNVQAMTSAMNNGDLGTFNQLNQQSQSANSLWMSYAAYGGSTQSNLNILGQIASAKSPQQFAFNMAVVQGDPMANAMWADQNGVFGSQDQRRLVQTGSRGGTLGMQAGYDETISPYSVLRRGIESTSRGYVRGDGAYSVGQLSSMNQVQVDDAMNSQQIQLRNYDFQLANNQMNRQISGVTGTGLGALSGSNAFGRFEGGKYSSLSSGLVEGHGQWYFENQNIALGRQQQDWSMNIQGQQLGIQQQQMNLGNQQYNENYTLNQQRFQSDTSYQRQGMQINEQHRITQRQWEVEDIAYNKNVSAVQFGFNMIDANEQIRYSTGRQRRDAMRHRDEAVVMQSMSMGHMDTEEDRAKTREKWAEDQFSRDKSHFEQGVRFQQQSMELDKKYHDQNRLLQQQNFDLSKQNFEKQKQFISEQRTLEDEQRIYTRAMQVIDLQEAKDSLKVHQDAKKTMDDLAGAAKIANDEMTRDSTALGAMAKNGSLLGQTFSDLGVSISTLINNIKNISGSSSGSASITPLPVYSGSSSTYKQPTYDSSTSYSMTHSFASGGFTGYGGKYEPAGVVHKGEYVVPQDGSLIIHGGNEEHVKILNQILQVLMNIHSDGGNPMIFASTPQQGVKKANSLMQQAYR